LKSFTAGVAKDAKESKSLTAKDTEDAEEKRSFNAKAAEAAKKTPGELLDALAGILIPRRSFPYATRGALGSSFARGAVSR
jgi:hypothetical protein